MMKLEESKRKTCRLKCQAIGVLLTHSLIHSLIDSFTHTLTLTLSLSHSHSYYYAIEGKLTDSLNASLYTHSGGQTHPLTH